MSKKQAFRQVPAREISPGAQLFNGGVVKMVARSGNDNTVVVWIDGSPAPQRLSGNRTLPVVNL